MVLPVKGHWFEPVPPEDLRGKVGGAGLKKRGKLN